MVCIVYSFFCSIVLIFNTDLGLYSFREIVWRNLHEHTAYTRWEQWHIAVIGTKDQGVLLVLVYSGTSDSLLYLIFLFFPFLFQITDVYICPKEGDTRDLSPQWWTTKHTNTIQYTGHHRPSTENQRYVTVVSTNGQRVRLSWYMHNVGTLVHYCH